MNVSGGQVGVSRWFGWCAVVLAAWLLAPARAQATNNVPYAESFEGYAPDTDLIDGTHWLGPVSGLVVRAMSNTYPLRFPLPSASHANVAELNYRATNFLNHAGGDTNLWLDFTVLPVRSPDEPDADNNMQMALYFNSNGHAVVWHSWLDKSGEGQLTNAWSELQHTPIPTDKWVRVTIKMDYLTGNIEGPEGSGYFQRFFQVSLNGCPPITNARALQEIPYDVVTRFPPGWNENDPGSGPLDAWQDGGTWFGCADNNWNANSPSNMPTFLSSVSLLGLGYLDDIVITNGNVLTFPGVNHTIQATATAGGTIYPGGALVVADGQELTFSGYALPSYYLDDVVVDGVPLGLASTNEFSYTFYSVISNHAIHAMFTSTGATYTTRGVDRSWMDSFGLSDYETDQMLDQDRDGALTWEEYVAGTDPTDSNSVFRVLSVSYEGAQNVVKWYATSDSGVTMPFSMLRSTNLTAVADAWLMVATNSIPRVSGTNRWTDTNPPAGPAYYRPIVLWPY